MLLNTFSSVPHRDVSIMFKDKKVLSFHLFPCFAQLSLLWKMLPQRNIKIACVAWGHEQNRRSLQGRAEGTQTRRTPLYENTHGGWICGLGKPQGSLRQPSVSTGHLVCEGRKTLLSVTYCLRVWLQGSTKRNRGEKHLCPCTQTHTPHYRRILINCVSLTQRQEFTEQFTPYLC